MRPVILTTEHKGVFFGFLEDDTDDTQISLRLAKCRNAIHWSGTRGFLGLASHGPEDGSRIGAEATSVLLHGVTSVTDCTKKAADKWTSWDK